MNLAEESAFLGQGDPEIKVPYELLVWKKRWPNA